LVERAVARALRAAAINYDAYFDIVDCQCSRDCAVVVAALGCVAGPIRLVLNPGEIAELLTTFYAVVADLIVVSHVLGRVCRQLRYFSGAVEVGLLQPAVLIEQTAVCPVDEIAVERIERCPIAVPVSEAT